MKSEWGFPFEARDFYFEKAHSFRGQFAEPIEVAGALVPGPTYSLRIEPSPDLPPDGIEQTGFLLITLSFREAASADLARYLAYSFAERVAFSSGDFRLNTALIRCKQIPETEAEEAEVGSTPYSMQLSMVEVVEAPPFNSTGFARSAGAPLDLLSQFNETKRDSSRIRQFLGYARILESTSYVDDDGPSFRAALSGNEALARHFHALLPEADFSEFVGRVVKGRHRCAHLKKTLGFGYAPYDRAVAAELAPELPLLEELARRCIVDSRDSDGTSEIVDSGT